MSRDATLAIGLGVIVVAVLAVVGLGAVGMSTTTTESGPSTSLELPPDDGSAGIVFDLIQTPGQSIFGLTLSADRYHAHIAVVVPDACVLEDADGTEVLRADGECAGLPVHGELTGGGTTPEGGRLAIVRVRVPRQCYESLEVGDPWPAPDEACNPGE